MIRFDLDVEIFRATIWLHGRIDVRTDEARTEHAIHCLRNEKWLHDLYVFHRRSAGQRRRFAKEKTQ